jgi:hypothetical protein
MTTRIYTEGRYKYRCTVNATLHYLKGNSAPYFSITADQYRMPARGGRWSEDSFGCQHDLIERLWPGKYSDIIAMHLADIDGAPMHAEANGWYQLAGALGGLGEQYHSGNQERYGRPYDAMQAFADHCRITREQAETIAAQVLAELGPAQESESLPAYRPADYKRARAKWATICESMRPRWEQEAQACIAKHGLTISGDAWGAA